MYNEELIKEAVDIATGDDGRTSTEVIEILRILKQEVWYDNKGNNRNIK